MLNADMAKSKDNAIFDGATLSPKLKPKAGVELGAPIGKSPKRPDVKTVARHYKHAAGKSDTYSPPVVDMIYHMARSGPFTDDEVCQFVAAKLEAERTTPARHPAPTFDQLVFLSANLTRLVIDPYREKCNSRVQIGAGRPQPLTLAWPIVIGPVDFGRLPPQLLRAALHAAQQADLAIFVDADWPVDAYTSVQRILQVDATAPLPDVAGAAAVVIEAPSASQLNAQTVGPVLDALRRRTKSQIPVGVTAPAWNAQQVVDETIELGVDFYVADAQWTGEFRPMDVMPELTAAPAIHVLADTVERLRHHCREQTVQVIYRGGIRGGADAGKALCIGATAVSLGLAAVVGMGFKVTDVSNETTVLEQLERPFDQADAIEHLVNFAKSVNIEVTMLARACGKSSVTNMEPEDLRALTIAVSAATGIPVAGKDLNFRHT